MMAESRTERVSGPGQVWRGRPRKPPCIGIRPKLGLKPYTPQNAAGALMDPAPSVPVPTGAKPAATAAALPPLEPAEVRLVSHGVRQSSLNRFQVWP